MIERIGEDIPLLTVIEALKFSALDKPNELVTRDGRNHQTEFSQAGNSVETVIDG